MSETIERKASNYLAQGRVTVVSVSERRGEFRVAGSAPTPYTVVFDGDWLCHCEARTLQCAHVVACQKITSFEPARRILFTDESDELSSFLSDAFGRGT